jgi:hypothetical protein
MEVPKIMENSGSIKPLQKIMEAPKIMEDLTTNYRGM